MSYKKHISSIMTSTPVVANASNKFSQVLQLFSQYGLHHLPVVDEDGKLIGIISSNDLPKVFNELCARPNPVPMTLEAIDASIKITDLMTTNVVTIDEDQAIDDALEIFSTKKFLALPVLDKDGALTGIVTGRDILEYVAYAGREHSAGYSAIA